MHVDLKNLKSLSILYVEDDDLIRNQSKSMFDSLFKTVFVAENGKDGLDLYNKHKDEIDVVVSDINMPELDGLGMSAMIRESDKDMPIILTTAYTDEEFLIRSMEVNINKYVTKPLKIKELAGAILEVIQKCKKSQTLEKATKELANANVEIKQQKMNMERAFDITNEELTYANNIINDYVSWFRVDKMGTFFWVSNKFASLFEIDTDDIVGTEVANINGVSCEGVSLQKQIFEVVYSKKQSKASHIFRLSNGKKIECETTVFPVFDADGEIDSYNFYQNILSC